MKRMKIKVVFMMINVSGGGVIIIFLKSNQIVVIIYIFKISYFILGNLKSIRFFLFFIILMEVKVLVIQLNRFILVRFDGIEIKFFNLYGY